MKCETFYAYLHGTISLLSSLHTGVTTLQEFNCM